MTERKIDNGVWFRSAVSGLWYQNADAAGAVSEVRVDGVAFYPSYVCGYEVEVVMWCFWTRQKIRGIRDARC